MAESAFDGHSADISFGMGEESLFKLMQSTAPSGFLLSNVFNVGGRTEEGSEDQGSRRVSQQPSSSSLSGTPRRPATGPMPLDEDALDIDSLTSFQSPSSSNRASSEYGDDPQDYVIPPAQSLFAISLPSLFGDEQQLGRSAPPDLTPMANLLPALISQEQDASGRSYGQFVAGGHQLRSSDAPDFEPALALAQLGQLSGQAATITDAERLKTADDQPVDDGTTNSQKPKAEPSSKTWRSTKNAASTEPTAADANKRGFESWTFDEKTRFFECLATYGRQFIALRAAVDSKTHDQVRNFYYRCLKRVNAILMKAQGRKPSDAETVPSLLHFWDATKHDDSENLDARKRPKTIDLSSAQLRDVLVESIQQKGSILHPRWNGERKLPRNLREPAQQRKGRRRSGSSSSRRSKEAPSSSAWLNESTPTALDLPNRVDVHTIGVDKSVPATHQASQTAVTAVNSKAPEQQTAVVSPPGSRKRPVQEIEFDLVALTPLHHRTSAPQSNDATPVEPTPKRARNFASPRVRIALQLVPLTEQNGLALRAAGKNPLLELVVKANKSVASIVTHLAQKWAEVPGVLASAAPSFAPSFCRIQLYDQSSGRSWGASEPESTTLSTLFHNDQPSSAQLPVCRLQYCWSDIDGGGAPITPSVSGTRAQTFELYSASPAHPISDRSFPSSETVTPLRAVRQLSPNTGETNGALHSHRQVASGPDDILGKPGFDLSVPDSFASMLGVTFQEVRSRAPVIHSPLRVRSPNSRLQNSPGFGSPIGRTARSSMMSMQKPMSPRSPGYGRLRLGGGLLSPSRGQLFGSQITDTAPSRLLFPMENHEPLGDLFFSNECVEWNLANAAEFDVSELDRLVN